MTLRAPYSLTNSEFNTFLFAPIGEEGNGMMLSVASALARLEIDPWEEAARLADLPKEVATTALDHLIERLPRGLWRPSDIPAIAASLIELLPRHTRAVASDRRQDAGHGKVSLSSLAWLAVLVLMATVFFGMGGDRTPRDEGGVTSVRASTTAPPAAR